ncbi:DUF2142 domain-containing protein [Pseudarthrobacter sp. NIBRBAC000502771]|uniref:DUF2142 domain-containing protein n=1 Tax=Pseudarthrobacter sp. NIBRBAC000502771 TaxID=2590774 RepID=UPI00112FD645|nr:DUF2142 domain-containing protein [Pseudarthrobacter sp. NIBRBAC000502771]QDG63011.1 DUF2142 domain-containing protein [Pseudarthrobacter sp. NIBRBAC000502771]
MPYSTRPLPTPKIRTAGPRRRTPSPIQVLIIAWLILGSLGSAWSFASPLMSVPDEPAHAIKAAAVARGQVNGNSTGVQGEPLTVNVPNYIAQLGKYSCFAQNSSITPDCSPLIDDADRAWVPAKTSAGNYNPIYYGIVGIGSRGLSGEPALYAMRLISTWMTAFFLASIFASASALGHFHRPIVAAAVALTPAVLFLTGSINPNGLEIATTGSVFMGLCAILEQVAGSLRISSSLLFTSALSGALLANTRPLSLLWLALAGLAAVLCYGGANGLRALAHKGVQLGVGLVALSSLFALWWVLSQNSFESLLAGTSPIPAEEAAVTMLDRSLNFVVEYVGVLGWLDTQPPAGVTFTWVLGFGALLFLAYTARPVRGRWVMALLTVTVIAVPTALQASSSEKLGWIWQGRYALAMVVTLILAAGVTTRFRQFRITPWSKSMIRWGLVLGVLAHTYIFLEGLRRYTIGIQDHVNWTEMFDPRWQPPLTWQGLAVIYIALLAAGAVCLYRLLTVKRAVFSLPLAESVSAVDRA